MEATIEEKIRNRVLPDGRMDVETTSLYLGLKSKTLAMLRYHKDGPRYTKMGKIFYFKKDLDEWILSKSHI